jgi:hypothetical protein
VPTVPVWQARNGHARAARILGREAATGWRSGHNAPATSAGSLARHRISPRWARPKITRSGGDWQGSSYGLIEVTSATTTIPSRNHEMTSASVDSGNPVLRPKTETPSRQGARHVGHLGRADLDGDSSGRIASRWSEDPVDQRCGHSCGQRSWGERGQDRAPTPESPRTRTGPPPGQTRPAREPPPGKRRAGPAGQGRRGLGGRRAAAGGGRREGESLRPTEPATTATFEWTEPVGRYGVVCPTSGGLGYLAPRSLVREWTRA